MDLKVPVTGLRPKDKQRWAQVLSKFSKSIKAEETLKMLQPLFQEDSYAGMSASLMIMGNLVQNSATFFARLSLLPVVSLAREAARAMHSKLFHGQPVLGIEDIFTQSRETLKALLERDCGCVDCRGVIKNLNGMRKFQSPVKLNPHCKQCPGALLIFRVYTCAVLGQPVNISEPDLSELIVIPAKNAIMWTDARVEREVCALATCLYFCLLFFILEKYLTADLSFLDNELARYLKSQNFPREEFPTLLSHGRVFSEWEKGARGETVHHLIRHYKPMSDSLQEIFQKIYEDDPEPSHETQLLALIQTRLWGEWNEEPAEAPAVDPELEQPDGTLAIGREALLLTLSPSSKVIEGFGREWHEAGGVAPEGLHDTHDALPLEILENSAVFIDRPVEWEDWSPAARTPHEFRLPGCSMVDHEGGPEARSARSRAMRNGAWVDISPNIPRAVNLDQNSNCLNHVNHDTLEWPQGSTSKCRRAKWRFNGHRDGESANSDYELEEMENEFHLSAVSEMDSLQDEEDEGWLDISVSPIYADDEDLPYLSIEEFEKLLYKNDARMLRASPSDTDVSPISPERAVDVRNGCPRGKNTSDKRRKGGNKNPLRKGARNKRGL
ncbi:tegument protein G48 [Common bottlenose dolphin gammaherpesvirus 1 strain Sarasota]|uniref:Tegument protein G48 n=1 Tax=Common bottlenose dolphin gammaherpesvirus 1 strain Sarasota TaxID=2022783 RepID=A0A1Z1NEH0_9GAMA|nr:tegument protein G48 [Common bottlenose dolphin gammaherpesvirus 1 strain Sarasota]ARW78110.1 tegument protein G48 [Common bottlenose dolphin gammaherpesvirus 1 strain Sarasota]